MESVGMNGMKLAALAAAVICAIGGVQLVTIEAAAENSILEAIAHGVGIYCIGKGVFVGALLWRSAD